MTSLLMLTPHDPFGPSEGTTRDLWAHIELLSAHYHLHLAICTPTPLPLPETPYPVTHIPRPERWHPREDPTAVRTLQTLIDRHQPAALLCHYADLITLVRQAERPTPLIFRAINAELPHAFEKYRTSGDLIRHPLYITRKLLRIAHKERLMHRHADHIFYIGHSDQQFSRIYGGRAHKHWLPPPIELPSLAEPPPAPPIHVIFVGGRSALNQRALEGLTQHIIPAVQAAHPQRFHFHIAGAISTDLTTRPGLTAHGYVPDLTTLMQQMHIACVPTTGGWGAKIKVIDALAHGLAVVGSPSAFRGIPPGETHLTCRTTADYLRAFTRLTDDHTRQQLAQRGRQALREWVKSGKDDLLRTLETLTRG